MLWWHVAQGVFDLPKKLRAAIDHGAYEVAVESYADVAPLFKKYGHKVWQGRDKLKMAGKGRDVFA